MNRKLTITLTEDELDIICNALCSFSIRYVKTDAHKVYLNICKLIPDDWNWAGDVEGED